MATEKKSNALAQYGPIAAPVLGVVLAVVFIAAALATSNVSASTDALSDASEKTRKQLDSKTATPPPGGEIPLADSVTNTFKRDFTNDWTANPGNRKLLGLPIKWEVTMEAPIGDLFSQMDENVDNYIDTIEFQRNMPDEWRGTLKETFNNWDRVDDAGNAKPDGLINRKEFDDPPTDDSERFVALDKDGDGSLTSKAGEATEAEVQAWDRYPFDGKISPQEYSDRYKPHEEVDLGAVENVAARADSATMEIVVTWDDPALAAKPSDLSFMIMRRAPETVAKRQSDYRRKMGEFGPKEREWFDKFDKWYSDPAVDAEGKTNKQKYPNKLEAQKAFAQIVPRPIAPQEAKEWELVTVTPVTGNEYRDKSFDMDVTYTYAVYMATQKFPKREQKARTDENYPGWFFYDGEPSVAAGHPVLVRNRTEINYSGTSGEKVNLTLTKWWKQEEPPTWYRVTITESVAPDDTVGGTYKLADLRSRNVAMKDAAGAELNAAELLPADVSIDFSTGFTFIIPQKGAVLTSRATGDFWIPTETKSPPTVPQGTASTDDALEVRCMTLTQGAKEATFELTRWTKAESGWLRVVLTVKAKNGAEVGADVNLGKLGSDVAVYDDAGKKLSASDIKNGKDITVDMKAGTFDGFEGRTLTVGGDTFDLFGTLYKG
jgi:hypothetical protein